MALKVSDKEVLCRVKARKKKVTNFRNSQKMPLKVGINLPNAMSSLRPTRDFFNEVMKVTVVTFREEGMEVSKRGLLRC